MQANTLRLELKAITKRFPGVIALNHVDFDIHAGEIHALVGQNGAGKSTLIKILTGIHSRTSGEILFNDCVANLNSPRDAEALGIAVVYQDITLVPTFNAVQNIFLGHELTDSTGRPRWTEMRAQTRRLLEELEVDVDCDVPVSELRRSDQQTVMICRALSREMRILILDEVTGAIPRDEQERLFNLVRRLRAQNVAIIYISHRLEEVLDLADRVTVLTNGRKVAAFERGRYGLTELISAMVGNRVQPMATAQRKLPKDIALRVVHLSGGEVQDVSFEVRQGEVVGMTGLLGSGKEEVARLLFGITPRRSGTVELFGNLVEIRRPNQAIAQSMFLVPESRVTQGLVSGMSVRQNLTLSNLGRVTGAFGLVREHLEQSLAQENMTDLGVDLANLDRAVGKLSGGNQQRIVIGKGLFTKARLMIFINPTHGVDVGARQDIYRLIGRLRDEGVAILLISSEISEIQAVSDRALVTCDGYMSATLDGVDVAEEDIIRHFYREGVTICHGG